MAIFDDDDVMEDDLDEFSGFEIIDDGADYRRKLAAAAEVEAETVATPVPENEQPVLVDNARFSLLAKGCALALKLTGQEGGIFYGESKVADLKPAYVAKLREQRAGQWTRVTLHEKNPAMVKLEFSHTKRKGFDCKIK